MLINRHIIKEEPSSKTCYSNGPIANVHVKNLTMRPIAARKPQKLNYVILVHGMIRGPRGHLNDLITESRPVSRTGTSSCS